MTKTADLYIRVSTDEQAEKGYSLSQQQYILEKYCEINKIIVRQIVIEDFSAKTFNRPEWNKLFNFLKINKNKSDLLLFTRWDRFSRNTSDAYQTIAQLKKMGIDAQAIEQQLNLNVPENKLMLAIYLTMPEIENDRKGLSTQAGLRRAKKEGRCTGRAPLGYINKTTGEGRKYIEIKDPEATIIAWIFHQLEHFNFAPENLLQIANAKGLTCSKNNFYSIIKNPIYCGRIRIPQYQDEETFFVTGIHKPIISEEQFDNVQRILEMRSESKGVTVFAHDQLPLRGFLFCSVCKKKLTGGSPGGNRIPIFYYHCNSKCSSGLRSDSTNRKFTDLINGLFVNKQVESLFIKIILKAHRNNSAHIPEKKIQLLSELKAINKKVNRARELKLEKLLSHSEFEQIKLDSEAKLKYLELELEEIKSENISWRNLKALSKLALSSLANLSTLFNNAKIGGKRLLISAIVNEKIIFDGNQFRHDQFNQVIQILIYINALIKNNYRNVFEEPVIVVNSAFISKLKGLGDLKSLVSEFDENGDIIKSNLELRKLITRTNPTKIKVRKRRLARKIIIKKWILESTNR